MKQLWFVLALSALSFGCGASSPATTAPIEKAPTEPVVAPVPSKVLEAKAFTTRLGSTLTVPAGWWVMQDETSLVLQDPERELKLWLIDIDGASNVEAIAQSWSQAEPGFTRAIHETVSPPSKHGWDEVTQIAYVVPPDESRIVLGVARRKGKTAHVVLLDAPLAAVNRRGAQMSQILESQKVAGLDEESFVGKKPLPFNDSMKKTLDEFIGRAMTVEKVPGVAIAVVQDGKVVYTKGYGVRALGGKPVTPETRFMIGSITKPFTSLMMAVLVDRDVITWDTPLKKVLPTFALGDPALSDKVLMHHSVCACTGLPRQDFEFLFQFDGISPEARMRELATMKPTTGFGETFQYSNALVSVGGFAAARALYPKKPLLEAYEKALTETVLEPLALKATTFRTQRVLKTDHAFPHGGTVSAETVTIPISYEQAVTSVVPAGGLWSNVNDLAKVMLTELANGVTPAGKRLISETSLMRRRQPSVKVGMDSHYGLALGVSDKKGLLTVGHSGGTLGFSTDWNFYPEKGFGFIILTNTQGGGSLISVVERRLIELLFDARPQAERDLEFSRTQTEASTKLVLDKLTTPPNTTWIEPLLGAYANESLGSLVVKKVGKEIIADAGEWQSPVSQYTEADKSVLMLTGPPLAGLTLLPQADGSLLFDAGQQQYFFKKR